MSYPNSPVFEDEIDEIFAKRASADEGSSSPDAIRRDNEILFQHIKAAPSGFMPKMSAATSRHVKAVLRENGFLEKMLPSSPSPQIDKALDYEGPFHIEEMEGAQFGACHMSLMGSADRRPFHGLKFPMYYEKYSSPVFTKHVDFLRNYTMNLRQVVSDNLVLDLEKAQDANYIRLFEQICGEVGGVGQFGVNQHSEVAEGIRRNSIADIKGILENRKVNNGLWLLNRVTSNEYLKWGRDEIGGDDAQTILRGGLKSLSSFDFGTVPHLATLKNEIVPNMRFYLQTEPEYLGKHYVLEDTHMYVKKEEDILSFHAVRKSSLAIANTRGLHIVDFTG